MLLKVINIVLDKPLLCVIFAKLMFSDANDYRDP